MVTLTRFCTETPTSNATRRVTNETAAPVGNWIDEPLDGTPLTGTLVGSNTGPPPWTDASYDAYYAANDAWLQLTSGAQTAWAADQFPAAVLGPTFLCQFDFYALGSADSIYFYWNCATPVTDEQPNEQSNTGFWLYFSEYHQEVALVVSQNSDAHYQDSAELDNLGIGLWRTCKFYYDHGAYQVFVDDVRVLAGNLAEATPELFVGVSNQPGNVCGLGARCGGDLAQQRVRRWSVTYAAMPPFPMRLSILDILRPSPPFSIYVPMTMDILDVLAVSPPFTP